jgi:hypothetical protein
VQVEGADDHEAAVPEPPAEPKVLQPA